MKTVIFPRICRIFSAIYSTHAFEKALIQHPDQRKIDGTNEPFPRRIKISCTFWLCTVHLMISLIFTPITTSLFIILYTCTHTHTHIEIYLRHALSQRREIQKKNAWPVSGYYKLIWDRNQNKQQQQNLQTHNSKNRTIILAYCCGYFDKLMTIWSHTESMIVWLRRLPCRSFFLCVWTKLEHDYGFIQHTQKTAIDT